MISNWKTSSTIAYGIVLVNNILIWQSYYYDKGVPVKSAGWIDDCLHITIPIQVFLQGFAFICCLIDRWPVMNFKDKEDIQEIEGNYFFEGRKKENHLLELVEAVETKNDLSLASDDRSCFYNYVGKVLQDESVWYLTFFVIGLFVVFVNDHLFCILLLQIV